MNAVNPFEEWERQPGEDEPDIIPYDPAWWEAWRRRCNALTAAQMASIQSTVENVSGKVYDDPNRPIGPLEAAFLGIVEE